MANNSIQLQSVGLVPAIPAGQLETGMVTVWNFGATETLLEKIKETPKTVWFKIRSDASGEEYTRRLSKTRLVATK